MRTLKIAGWIVGALAALIVLGIAAVFFLVDPNDYRDDIAQRVEQATGRPLKIAGSLHLKFFPWLALQVSDVSLGNPAGYGAAPFLTVQHADVGVKLLPLLRKQFEVRRITLGGLAVNLVSRSKDDNNWKDLTDSDKPKQPTGGAAPQARIAGVDVRKATLLYRDEEKKSLIRLSNIELQSGAAESDMPVPVRVEFDYNDETPSPPTHLTTAVQVRMPKDSSRVELKNLTVQGAKFSVSSPALLIDTAAETLAPATLQVKVGELPLQVTATGEKLFSDRAVTGKISMSRLSPRQLLPSMGVKLPVMRDPTVLGALTFASNYRLTEKALQLTDLDLKLDDTHVRGSLGVTDLHTKALAFNLEVDSVNVDRYREPEVKSQAAKQKKPPTPLPIEALRKLNAKGALRIGRATFADMKFTDVHLPVEATGGRILLSPQAGLFGGSYKGEIVLDARSAKAKLSLNEHARGLDIGQLVKAAFDSTRITGRGDANAVLNGVGNTDAAILGSLSGKIDANVKEGAFNGVDLWYELRRALALVKRTPAPVRTQPVRTQFKAFAGSATLAEGMVHNDDLRVDMDYLKANGKGTLNIATQAIDYRVVAEIYKLPAESAGSEMADLKALEIPIAITGTLADIKVRPDLAGLAKARLNKEVDKQKDELKKKLGDKLKDLLGH